MYIYIYCKRNGNLLNTKYLKIMYIEIKNMDIQIND